MRQLRKLIRDERGGTLIEYALILGLIFVTMMVAVGIMAGHVVNTLNYVSDRVVNASTV